MPPTKESNRQENATDYPHATELQALIARLRPERIRRRVEHGVAFHERMN